MIATLANIFPKPKRRSAKATERLVGAYRSLFAGNGGEEDAGIVLADLAKYSGYFHVDTSDMTAQTLAFNAGQRNMFGRIISLCSLSQEQQAQILEAVRLEDYTDATEGSEL